MIWHRLADWYMRDIDLSRIGRVGWVPLEFDDLTWRRERDQVITSIARGYGIPRHLIVPDPWPGYRRWPQWGLDLKMIDLMPRLPTTLAQINYGDSGRG